MYNHPPPHPTQPEGIQQPLLKTAVLNLTEQEVNPSTINLLNLGPKYVPTPTTIPFMDIVTSTECAALQLDRDSNQRAAESMRQDVSKIMSKFLNTKPRSNLTIDQRQALKNLKTCEDTAVYPFD